MKSLAYFFLFSLLAHPLQAQNSPQDFLGDTLWTSAKEDMAFARTAHSVAIRNKKPEASAFQNLTLVHTLDGNAWVFRKGFNYFGLAFTQNREIVTVEGSTPETTLSNLQSGRKGMGLKRWKMGSNNPKNGMFPEVRLADTLWRNGSEEMIFHHTGKSVAFRPEFPAQRDFTPLSLERTLEDKGGWVFRRGAGYFGVRFQRENLITVENLSLDTVVTDISSSNLPSFRYTLWKPAKKAL